MSLEIIEAIKSALDRVDSKITLTAPRRLAFFGAMANGLPNFHAELLDIYLVFREDHHNDKKSKSEYEKEFENYVEKGDRHFNTIFKIFKDELKVELTKSEKDVLSTIGQSSGERAYKVAKTPLENYRAGLLDLNDPEGSRDYTVQTNLPTPNTDPTFTKYFHGKGLPAIAGNAYESYSSTIIPLSDLITTDGHNEFVYNYQTITECGKKRTVCGLVSKGLVYFVPNRETVYSSESVGICEGAATAESVFLCTGIPQIAAINPCNISLSAISLIEYGTNKKILFMADTKAKGYAELDILVKICRTGIKEKNSNCLISYVVPKMSGENKDFNDLMIAEGSEVVKVSIENAFNSLTPPVDANILDDDNHYCTVDLAKHLPEQHLLRKLSREIHEATYLPQSTVILIGLGVFSSVSNRVCRVKYEHGGSVPLINNVIGEQPSGASKSRCIGIFSAPFQKAHMTFIKTTRKLLQNAKSVEKPDPSVIENLESQLKISLFATNTTPEGLEKSLAHSKGAYAVVSAEQGAVNSLLGLAYGDSRASNNDLMLHGYTGEYMSVHRATRDAFSGFVYGGLTVFAQPGTVETVLNQSNGTGLSERFLMLAEPHALGYRDWTKVTYIDEFYVNEYEKICSTFSTFVLQHPKNYEELPYLTIESDGWRMIAEFRNHIEPELRDGGKFSHISLRGTASKVDMQIMKISANLHLLTVGFDTEKTTIPTILVKSAIGIVGDLLLAQTNMLKDKGITGVKAEWQSVISYLSKRSKGAVLTDLVNSLRTTKPFKDLSGNKSAAIKKTIKDMVEADKLEEKNGIYFVI